MKRRNPALLTLAVLGLFSYLVNSAVLAADDVAAKVGDVSISTAEAERLFIAITGGKEMNADLAAAGRAQVIEEIVTRQLVLAYAHRTGAAPTDEEIDAAEAKLKTQIAAKRGTHPHGLQADSAVEEVLRRRLEWGLVWDKYMARYDTPERRAIYFDAHRQDLDGTELVVSHILLRTKPNDPADAVDQLLKRSESIRLEIVGGKTSFEAAAKKYSDGPSGASGGRLGKIGRHGPMEDSFNRAAFALSAGEISPPVKTSFGVDLIRCDEIVPGKKQPADVAKDVVAGLERELLDKLSGIERKYTLVTYTSAWPHFKPGTKQLEK